MQAELQELCERGQQQLMRMEYLAAEATLTRADALAQDLEDYNTISRLYLPLQEARRQRRQRCGEGIVKLDFLPRSASDPIDVEAVVRDHPHGQFLIAGWGSCLPGTNARRLQHAHQQYAETILAAVYLLEDRSRAVVLVPLSDVSIPDANNAPRSIEQLRAVLPPYSAVLHEREIPAGALRGTAETCARVMTLWEQLHAPFLAAADAGTDPIRKMDGYRRAIDVDYACELAHQRLSATAQAYAREPHGHDE